MESGELSGAEAGELSGGDSGELASQAQESDPECTGRIFSVLPSVVAVFRIHTYLCNSDPNTDIFMNLYYETNY